MINPNGTVDLPNGAGTIKPNGPVEVDKDGNVTIPTDKGDITVDSAGTITVPNGTVINPNGTVDLPNGAGTITPEGGDATVGEDGSMTIPTQDGTITVDPEGNMTVPNGGAHDTEIEAGADVTVDENGVTVNPNGTVINPNGTVDITKWSWNNSPNGPVEVDKDGNVTIPTVMDQSQWIQLERLQYQIKMEQQQ